MLVEIDCIIDPDGSLFNKTTTAALPSCGNLAQQLRSIYNKGSRLVLCMKLAKKESQKVSATSPPDASAGNVGVVVNIEFPSL